jgi:hypothetical protein
VTNPSLFKSAAVKTLKPAPPRPPPRPPGAGCCASNETKAPAHKAAAPIAISYVAVEFLNGMFPPVRRLPAALVVR